MSRHDDSLTLRVRSKAATPAEASVFARPIARSFSATHVNEVVASLARGASSPHEARQRWLEAVATRLSVSRPDLAAAVETVLRVRPYGPDYLAGLSIGEISVCYEALLAVLDHQDRRKSGQFFTPDDAAQFMANRARSFGHGRWIDPCCGVGNLSWHLTAAQDNPASFIRSNLVLIDRDEAALRSAIALIAGEFASENDVAAVEMLANNSVHRDALAPAPLPPHDFAILNPPYARAQEDTSFLSAKTRDLFAYFLEKVATSSQGFVAVTPASYLSAPKFASLRSVLRRNRDGGDVFVFDNVPDTLFRGYKYGSSNTSKTNFVRAAVTSCAPSANEWRITPILRWRSGERAEVFGRAEQLLTGMRLGPDGEWVKLAAGLAEAWDGLATEPVTIRHIAVSDPTEFFLEVGTTPRYYISATFRTLNRASKARLYFANSGDRDRAAIVLNSSLPYIWWRALDGGVSLPRRVLLSTPVPARVVVTEDLVSRLRESERDNLVVKLNAGRYNENVKHPAELVHALNEVVLPPGSDVSLVYANSMFG